MKKSKPPAKAGSKPSAKAESKPSAKREIGFREAVVAWALARARRVDPLPAREALDGIASPLPPVVECFALSGEQRELLELLYARERSAELGACWPDGRLTVERLRALLGPSVDQLLRADGALRSHALVWVAGASSAAWDAEVRLGWGLAARFDGHAQGDAGWLDGVSRWPAPLAESWVMRFSPSQRVIDAVPRSLGDAAQLLVVASCGRRDALSFSVELAERAHRGLLVVDGGLIVADAPQLLPALRREAELEGLVLLVHDGAALGDEWRRLCRAPAANPPAPLLVVWADARSPEAIGDVLTLDKLRARLVPLAGERPTPAAEAKPAEPTASSTSTATTPAPAPVDDSFDEIRKRAQRDAERALGVWKEAPIRHPIPPPKQKPTVAPLGYEKSVAAMKGEPSSEKIAAPEASKAEPPAETKAEPEKVEVAKKAEPVKKAEPPRYSANAARFFKKEAAPPPPPPVHDQVPSPVAGVDFPPSGIDPLPVPERAGPRQWSQLAQTSPSPEQRIEMLALLRPHKGSEVVAALRANTTSQHVGVRAAAEAGMASLFGPSWNQTRAVPKPVQPPRSSDDEDKGPPGGMGR